jgi:hypothetical protein
VEAYHVDNLGHGTRLVFVEASDPSGCNILETVSAGKDIGWGAGLVLRVISLLWDAYRRVLLALRLRLRSCGEQLCADA